MQVGLVEILLGVQILSIAYIPPRSGSEGNVYHEAYVGRAASPCIGRHPKTPCHLARRKALVVNSLLIICKRAWTGSGESLLQLLINNRSTHRRIIKYQRTLLNTSKSLQNPNKEYHSRKSYRRCAFNMPLWAQKASLLRRRMPIVFQRMQGKSGRLGCGSHMYPWRGWRSEIKVWGVSSPS